VVSLEYGLLAAFATVLGGLLVAFFRKWSHDNRDTMLAFAAGVLIGLAFLEIGPEALAHEHGNAALYFTLGFYFMFFIESLAIPHHGHSHDDEEHEHTGLGYLAWAGVLVHSFVDGLAISAGAAIHPALAKTVTAGVVMHELPEGLLSASLLLAGGMKTSRMLFLTALVAFATPAGALVSDLWLHAVSVETLKDVSVIAVALAGGTFVYVGAVDMLHHAKSQPGSRMRLFAAFSVGLAIFVAKALFFPE
jgi:zinc transporter ZupT